MIEPPQGSVAEKILRHCGLWREPSPRGPPDDDAPLLPWDGEESSSEVHEVTFVDEATFWATF